MQVQILGVFDDYSDQILDKLEAPNLEAAARESAKAHGGEVTRGQYEDSEFCFNTSSECRLSASGFAWAVEVGQ